jgi:hypothetical protein
MSLDGSPMPSSGKAESAGVDISRNLDAALRAAGAWSAPPLLRPSMHADAIPATELLCAVAVLLALGAAWRVRRARTAPLGNGTVALAAFCAFLLGWYVLNFGPFWFMERYLAPLLLLTVPFLATAFERSRPRPRTLGVLAAVVLVANVPVLAVLAGGPEWPPPAGAGRDSKQGAHPNRKHLDQYAWVRANVAPGCVVGAYEAGTLVYFRDGVVNLDGKVDHEALEAREAGRSPAYVDARRVDVMMDISSGIERGLKGRRGGWRLVEAGWRYEAWVRRTSEATCLRDSG